MNLSFTLRARADLRAIRDHIAEDNPAAAERTLVRILQSIAHLEQFPLLGREGLVTDTRELTIPGLPFVAVYRASDTQVDILTIVHSRQKYP